jgi:phage protein D
MALGLDIPLGGATAAATRAPAFDVAFGSGAWADHVVSITVEAGIAPAVGAAEIVLGAGEGAPEPAVGDSGSVALGYADASTETVFTGTVGSVERTLAGATRIVATDGGAALAALRVDQSYEQQAAGDIVSDLAGRAGVSAGAVDQGSDLAHHVVDGGRSAWAHIGTLATRCGFVAYVAADGSLAFGPYAQGAPALTLTCGEDVLALDAADAPAAAGTVTAIGEGAAGSEGQAAWSWLLKDPAAVTSTAGSGDPARLLADGSLRSAAAAQAAATGLHDAGALAASTARALVPGAPAAVVGGAVEVAGAPDGALDGTWLVRGIRHAYSKRRGFTTLLLLARAGGGSLL